MPGWLERLPVPLQHLIIGVLFVVLAWTAEDLIPVVSGWLAEHPPLGPVVGILLSQLVLYASPLIRAYGATWTRDGRHEDAGRVDVRAPLAVVAVAASVFLVVTALRADAAAQDIGRHTPTPPAAPTPARMPVVDDPGADRVVDAHWRRGRPLVAAHEHIRTNGAWSCRGTLLVAYGVEDVAEATEPSDIRVHAEWSFTPDDGDAVTQVHTPGAGWRTVPATSGGEGWRRLPGYTTGPDKARVIRAGVASSPKIITEGCPT